MGKIHAHADGMQSGSVEASSQSWINSHANGERTNALRPISLRNKDEKDFRATKVGVIPFMSSDPPRLLVMKPIPTPKAMRLGLAPSQFQLAKGTRRNKETGKWLDIRGENDHPDPRYDEALTETAFREGKEEVGLKKKNIRNLYDLGRFHIISATRGDEIPIHMFAAEVKDEKDFGPFDASTTGERRWITLDEFAELGRQDHYAIAHEAFRRIRRYAALHKPEESQLGRNTA